jgi:glycosyltransferase involved in cell wall biosynthesis
MLAPHVMLVEAVASRATEFDVIHFHIAQLHYPLMRRLPTAHVTTLHGRLDLPELQPFYRVYSDMPVVSISNAQRQPLPQANWIGTVYHGLPPAAMTFRRDPEGYLAFLGRISPEKRVDRAIAIARTCRVPIRIAAKVDPADEKYFRASFVRCSTIRWSNTSAITITRRATFSECPSVAVPDRLARTVRPCMIEALGCGTPVVAFRSGSVPKSSSMA